MWTQSFTPANKTDWLPNGIPARAIRSQASASSWLISLGWLMWMLIHNGWNFCSISHSSCVTRIGRKTGTREPIRTISMCGISRKRVNISSRILGARTSGSPPESNTSRTCGVRLRYSICASNSCREKVWPGSPTMRERVQ